MISLTLAGLLALTPPTSTPADRVLPLVECLRPERIDAWHVVPERALIVRSGSKHFRVDMLHACPGLGDGGVIRLQGSQATRGFICGGVGETAATRRSRCAIGTVAPLSRAAYFRELEEL